MKPQPTAVKRTKALTIADDIRMQIERGDLKPGDPIPTIQQLQDTFGCTVITAREAHGLLKEQGLVSAGRGKPLTVRVEPRRILRSSTRHQIEKDLARKPYEERSRLGTAELETGISFDELVHDATYERIKADQDLAEAFGRGVGTELLERTYETTLRKDGSRNAWSVSYLPVDLIGANPDFLDPEKEPWAGGTQYQLSTLGIEIVKMIDVVTSRMPTTAERSAWDLERGIPLLQVRRMSVDAQDRVVEVSDALFPADRTNLEFISPLERW